MQNSIEGRPSVSPTTVTLIAVSRDSSSGSAAGKLARHVLDARDYFVELKRVVGVQLAAQHRPEPVHVQLTLLPHTKNLQTAHIKLAQSC